MKILGLEINTKQVRAVEIDSSLGRFGVHDYHEVRVAEGETSEQAAARLVRTLPQAPDKIVTSLGSRKVTFRNLHVPTRSKRAIQSAVAFQLEDELPFDAEDATYDFTHLSQSKTGTHVHVAATLRKHVEEEIHHLVSSGIDPDLITTDAWALRCFLNRIVPRAQQESPLLLILTSPEKPLLYIHWKGTPVLCREIGADDWMAGVRQADLTCRHATGLHIQSVMIGGDAQIVETLSQSISSELSVTCSALRALTSVSTSGVQYSEEADTLFLIPVALALCMVGSDRSSAINFRKGAFSKAGSQIQINFQTLRGPMIALAGVVFCVVSSVIIQRIVLQKSISDVDVRLDRSVRAFLGTVAPSAMRGYLSNPDRLKKAVEQNLSNARELAKLYGTDPRSPIDALRGLSLLIGKNVVVDMIRFRSGSAPSDPFEAGTPRQIELAFVVSNPQTIERLAELLPTHLENITRSKAEPVTQDTGGEQKWKVTFTGKLKESIYGN